MSKPKPFYSLCAVLMALCLGFSAVPAMAQSQATTGQIAGAVVDNQGAAITGATVKATNTQTGLSQSVTSGDDGLYRLVLLPPGVYKVTAEASGFASTTVDNVEVTVGRTIDVKITMGVSGVQEVVNVTAGAIQVQTTRSEADAVLNQRAIDTLPINGRRFQDFVTLTPTAQVDPQRGQISLAGQRGINSNIQVDGADYNNPFFGGIRGGERSNTAFTIPQESIKEFQVVASGYTAEFGRSTGGIVNAVTKSGNNDWHGSGFYLMRPKEASRTNAFFKSVEDNLNLNRPAGSAPLKLVPAPTQQQFGGSFGGPVKKDKAFFFAAYEQQRFRNNRQVFFDTLSTITPAAATQEAFSFFLSQQTPFVQTNDANAVTGRFDYEINSKHRFNVRYGWSRNEALNANATGNALFPTTVSALSNNGTEKDGTHSVVGQFTSFFSTSTVNEFRGQFVREERPRPANAISPTVETVVGRFGTVLFLGQNFQFDRRIQAADSLTWSKGAHTAKFGSEFNHVFISQLFGFNQTGRFIVSGSNVTQVLDLLSAGPGAINKLGRFDCPRDLTKPLATQCASSPSVTFVRQIGNLMAAYATNEVAVFAQDSWRIRPNLTLNYGLRWEGQYNPAPEANNTSMISKIQGFQFPSGHIVDPTKLASDPNQWGPRLGFAWDPWSDGKTVVRGYAGIYYARTPLLLLAGAFNNFRVPAGDLSVQLPFTTTGPNKTVYQQLKLIGIDLNNFTLDKLPDITPDKVQAVAQALGLSPDPFFGAAPILNAPDYKNPKAYQAGFGVERQLSSSFTVGADFTYVHTVHLERNRDLNLPLPTVRPTTTDPAQRPFFDRSQRPITSLQAITMRETTGHQLYRAFTLRAKFQRKWGQFNAFYTLSKNLTEEDNERDATGFRLENQFNAAPEYADSDLDRRHQFVANPVLFFPHGIDFSSAVRLFSGVPVDARFGSDANGDNNNNDRPFLGPSAPFRRNAFRNFAVYLVDVRGQKHFSIGETKRLVFTAEIFNLFNTQNIVIGSGNNASTLYCASPVPANCGFTGPTNPNFLQLFDRNPSSTRFGKFLLNNNPGPPFQMQFGARFQF